MKKLFTLLLALLAIAGVKANDGVYYTSGNQLIPITETEISVKKEILDITRHDNLIQVHVYYEFFNPGKEKTLLVGFEALPPSGVWETTEEEYMKITDHPNIHDFTVTINGQRLDYQVSHVEGDMYYSNGKFNELSKQRELEMGRETEFYEGIQYLFVYHFNAVFKKGLNIVEHTYTFDESVSVGEEFAFDYVLTAANRWANHQIDDFTLNIDMGDRQSFSVRPEFFKSLDEWTINGKGRTSPGSDKTMNTPMFHIQEGSVTFHKMNFHPEGELEIFKVNSAMILMWGDKSSKDVKEAVKQQYSTWMLWAFEEENEFTLTKDDKRILRNLPFAYRGFVFKTPSLQQFFESTNWYIPNPKYVDRIEELSESEREWIEYWSK